MQNKGKLFEQDFKKSLEENNNLWIYRPSDFGGGTAGRFTNHSLCDYIIFDKSVGKIYFFELKSSQGTSISCPSIQAISSVVEAQKTLDDIQVKEDKKQAVRAYKELVRKANAHDIKLHQIKSLYDIQTKENIYDNMCALFVLNFRTYNKTYAISATNLLLALKETNKASINIKDCQEYGGIEIMQSQIGKSQRWHYNLKEIIK